MLCVVMGGGCDGGGYQAGGKYTRTKEGVEFVEYLRSEGWHIIPIKAADQLVRSTTPPPPPLPGGGSCVHVGAHVEVGVMPRHVMAVGLAQSMPRIQCRSITDARITHSTFVLSLHFTA